MSRFLHRVGRIMIVDGDDVRGAPMLAELIRHYFNHDPLFRLWGTTVVSAGAGPFAKEGAHPVDKAQTAMQELGLNISGHAATHMFFPGQVADASLVLAIKAKDVTYLKSHQLAEYPSLHSRVVTFLGYIGLPAVKVPALLGAKQSEYKEFAGKMQNLVPMFGEKLRQDTRRPFLVRGIGLGGGEATGKVRLVKSEEDAARIERGDVVVCEINDIRSQFGREVEAAAAVVSTSSSEAHNLSQLGHACGIPCISGASHAMETLREGEIVCVHGNAGAVYGEPSPVKKMTMAELMAKYGLAQKGKLKPDGTIS